VIALLVLIGAGMAVYFGLVFGLGAYSLATLKGQLRRKR
jgi:putative peptidoglycan lipid II flippase